MKAKVYFKDGDVDEIEVGNVDWEQFLREFNTIEVDESRVLLLRGENRSLFVPFVALKKVEFTE